MDVTFIAERKGLDFVGQVIDLATQEVVARTGLYASAETAKSAAHSLWIAKQKSAQGETESLTHILRNYGTAVALMPHDVAAYYLCFRCAGDSKTVRNMRETITPSLRASPTFGSAEIDEAIAAFDARFPVEIAA